MKYIPFALLLLALITSAQVAAAQVATAQVNRSTQAVGKQRLDGYAATTSIDERFVEQKFKEKLAEYGRVEGARGVLRVNFARLPFVDNGKLIAEVKSVRKQTRIFLAAAQGNPEESVADSRVGEILTDFLRSLDSAEQVRQAETEVAAAEKKNRDLLKLGEKLTRDIEKNQKDHERLLKQIADNEANLLKLQADVEQNKKQQETALQDLDLKRTEASRVKTRN